ncbi:hypothetical protein VNI00_007932 [Paramarasmius palmivorus]|uniref:Uncharacterized protein n=1 Tax=Paramarasmius palmivorus TaxID=297713 RepID=A0AAW0D080_9AGAR
MAISIVLFILTMYKCGFRFYKDKFGNNRRMQTPLLSLFMRDGIYWFVPVLGLFISQIIITTHMRATLGEILINPCMVGYSVITSRILLNMKEISVEKTTNTSVSDESQRGGPILLEDMHSTPSKRVSLGRVTIEVHRSI